MEKQTSKDLELWNRSPMLMNSSDTALVVIDVQEKLLPLITDQQTIRWNIGRLLAGANTLGLPIVLTEQYPQGLGGTVVDIAQAFQQAGGGEIANKLMFSCRECRGKWDDLLATGISKVLLTGIEAHVCVAQTALDLMSVGFNVYLAVDAIGSRFSIDFETAVRRLESSGATLTTTEAALFEWCERAGNDRFKQISKLVREPRPVPTSPTTPA